MKKIIIIRHGKHGPDDHLSKQGIDEIKYLAYDLKEVIAGASALIFTSPAVRAEESADIISEILNVNYEKHEILLSGKMHATDRLGLLKLINERQEEAEVIVLVTHLEYAESFPGYFGRNFLKTYLPTGKLKKGEALVIDCEKMTTSRYTGK